MRPAARTRLAQAHYEDAVLYQHRYSRRRHDLAFYSRHARGKVVLELGAGSGRVTAALAEAAKRVVALERSVSLARVLRERLDVEVVRADFMKWRPRARFSLVCAPFHVLSHVHDGAALHALFVRIRSWLTPGGHFVFDVPNPDLRMLATPPGRTFKMGHASDGRGKRYRYSETFSYAAREQEQLIVAHYEGAEDFALPLLHRHYFPAELSTLLRLAGFRIESHDGDFEGGALTAESEEQVIVARQDVAKRRK